MASQAYDRRNNLIYVRDMLRQLTVVSGAREGSVLACLMDMARLETESEIAAEAPPSKEQ